MAPEPGADFAELDLVPEERFVPLRRMLNVSTFGLNEIVLQPGQRGRIHRHERQEEVYLVFEGELTLSVEGEERTLPRGAAARVGPDVRRQLINVAAEPCVLIAIGGAEQHEGRDGVAYESWQSTDGRRPQEVPLPADLER
jgi:mannose-6-phosphate isomerase-like protein (cupin superfamily)